MRDIPDGFMNMIISDIEQIDSEVENGTFQSRLELHRRLDARYQSCIERWYAGLWCTDAAETKMRYNYLADTQSVVENLTMMKGKLETYRYQMNAVSPSVPTTQVNVTTNVNVELTFNEARNRIDDMTALSQPETDEINKRIDELEAISKETISRKKKWEKVKPIIAFALDKGADVAITILGLVMQMKLGM